MRLLINVLGLLFFCFQILGCEVVKRNSIEEIVSKHIITYSTPPQKIPVPYSVDAPMLGNGYTGVAISGEPNNQVYYLARNDFWRLKSSLGHSYPAVLGKVEIKIPGLEGATYELKQELYHAKTYSNFSKKDQKVEFVSYVSALEDLMIVEIKLNGEGELDGYVSLELPDPKEIEGKPLPAETEKGVTDEGIYYISKAYVKDVDIPTKAVCALKILDQQSNKFNLSESKSITIAIALSSNFKSENCLQTVVDRLKSLHYKDLKTIEASHESWWERFWSMSYVEINDPVIEKQYYLSNYSMASFSRDLDFPPSLFGTCITKEIPHWQGDYHLNYNHLAPYYGLFSSNHIEQAIPCNMPILAQKDRGEYYSEKICGIKGGILLPVGAGPLGIETTRINKWQRREKMYANWIENRNVEDEGLFWKQKSNSSYCVVNMAMHFYMTYDKEFTHKYYPFVKGVATFWENYLTWENGRYVVYNDAIHEGNAGMNPLLALGLIRLVLQTAIDMSKDLNTDSERIEKWKHIIDNLSDYTYQEREGKKVFRYTEKGLEWNDDNTLGIQHIYPAGQIGLDSDPELLKVAYNTVDVMQRWLDYNGSNSFFPAAVRVGYNPDTILVKMREYCEHTYPNGYQLNNPHGIENFSTIPNTINEMLCMSHGGILRLFPVWPKEKNAKFHNLRTHGAFLVSSELKDGQVLYVDILSEKGKECLIENPWPGKEVKVTGNKSKDKITKGRLLNIITHEGEEIKLSPL